MVPQVAGLARRAVCAQVARRCAQYPINLSHPPRHKCRRWIDSDTRRAMSTRESSESRNGTRSWPQFAVESLEAASSEDVLGSGSLGFDRWMLAPGDHSQEIRKRLEELTRAAPRRRRRLADPPYNGSAVVLVICRRTKLECTPLTPSSFVKRPKRNFS